MSLDQNLSKILIIDIGSKFTQLIARRIRELGVFSEIISHKKINNKDIDKTIKGIILSGGPLNVYEIKKYSFDKKIIEKGLPILGICFGHQILSKLNGGKVKQSKHREFGLANIYKKKDSLLIKKFFNKTIILSGCISTGRDIASAMQMGADFAYMGTRFINTKESLADEGYKDMIINSKADDIIYTAAVSGVNANFLKPSLEAMGINEDMWKNSKKIDFGKELSAAEAEAKAWKTIWSAGQGVTSINDSPSVADLVNNLKEQFIESINDQKKLLDNFS